MALFGSKKNTAPAAEDKKVAAPRSEIQSVRDVSHIIKKPRITEKASLQAEQGTYVFEVAQTATKGSVAAAVKELYNVTPVRVAITQIPDKKIMTRRGLGTKRGGKKAYVYLKKGDSIEII